METLPTDVQNMIWKIYLTEHVLHEYIYAKWRKYYKKDVMSELKKVTTEINRFNEWLPVAGRISWMNRRYMDLR